MDKAHNVHWLQSFCSFCPSDDDDDDDDGQWQYKMTGIFHMKYFKNRMCI